MKKKGRKMRRAMWRKGRKGKNKIVAMGKKERKSH